MKTSDDSVNFIHPNLVWQDIFVLQLFALRCFRKFGMKVLSFVQLKIKKLIIVPQKLILTSLLFIIIYTSIIYFYGIKIKVIEK